MQQVDAVSLCLYGPGSAWSRSVLPGFTFSYASVGRVVLNPSPATGRSRIAEVGCGSRERELCTWAGASQRYSAD